MHEVMFGNADRAGPGMHPCAAFLPAPPHAWTAEPAPPPFHTTYLDEAGEQQPIPLPDERASDFITLDLRHERLQTLDPGRASPIFVPSRRNVTAGMAVAVLGFATPADAAIRAGFRGQYTQAPVPSALHRLVYSDYREAAFGVGRVVEVTSHHIVHDAPVTGGQAGGPLIPLDELMELFPRGQLPDPSVRVELPFIGVQSTHTPFGYATATRIDHPGVVTDFARHVFECDDAMPPANLPPLSMEQLRQRCSKHTTHTQEHTQHADQPQDTTDKQEL